MRKGLLILIATALAAGVAPFVQAEENSVAPNSVYTAEVRVDPLTKQVAGSVEILFSPKQAGQAYLHLYPSAFASIPPGEAWLQLLGADAAAGAYAITSLAVQGKAVPIKQTGTLLEVPLAAAEKAGAVSVELAFELTMPRNEGRMSYDDHALWLGNWLPVLAVYDSEGWHLDPYVPIGDPFYSETSDYHLSVTIPDTYQLASTATDGEAFVDRAVQGESTYHLQARNVRDFALVIMDDSYRKWETQVGTTLVRTWWREGDDEEQAKLQHEAAWQSLAYFGEQFGTYPYAEYDVVRTGGSINGMEYPALVFVDERHFGPVGVSTLSTVVHETAHQWFYGIVGNNQWQEAWLDEGLAEYASVAFLYEKDRWFAANQAANRLIRGTAVSPYAQRELSVWQRLDAYPDNQSYGDLVYSRAFSMLWLLRGAWGEERLHAVLRKYAEENWFGVGNGEDFVTLLSDEAGEDASSFIAYWLYLDMEKRAEAEAWLKRQHQQEIGGTIW